MTKENAPLIAAERDRVRLIQVQEETILTLDFSHATPAQSLAMLEELPRIFEGQALDSVRILSDVTDVSYDAAVSQKWKMALMKFDPYVRASAVHGATGLSGVAMLAFVELMHWLQLPKAATKIRGFKDREKALAWLLES
jgi:hypothetical protein